MARVTQADLDESLERLTATALRIKADRDDLLDACKAAREVLGKQPYHPRDAAADAAFDLCNVAIARAEGR